MYLQYAIDPDLQSCCSGVDEGIQVFSETFMHGDIISVLLYTTLQKRTWTDLRSNTAQILTSLAEGLSRQHTIANEDSDQEARAYLQEALDLFQRCFELQTSQYEKFQAQLAAIDNPSSEASIGRETKTPEDQQAQDGLDDQEERWVTVTSPVSKETLRETILAQLETLTSLCDVCRDDKLMYLIEQYAEPIITEKLAVLVDGTDRELEAAIARAAYICAVADTKFRLGYPGTDVKVRDSTTGTYPFCLVP